MKTGRVIAGMAALAFVFGGTALPTYFNGFDTAMTASAYDNVTDNGVKYIVYDDHAVVTDVVKDSLPSKLVLPSTVNGKPLTEIGQNSLNNCDNLVEVVIPDSVEIIKWGFMGCKNLKKVIIGNGVTEITGSTFHSCESLTEVVFGNNVQKIGGWVFYNCTSLTEIKIPDSVTELGDNAFYACTNLKKVELSDNITVLEDNTFQACKALEEVKLPSKLEKIRASCFHNCSSLKELTIPKGVKQIDFEFISGTEDLTLEIPASVKTINDYAFQNAKNIKVKCYEDTAIYNFLVARNEKNPDHQVEIISLGPVPKTKGDVNDDGAIDIEDAVMVINHVNGAKALADDEAERANVDDNADVDIEDAVAIIAHVNGVKSLN